MSRATAKASFVAAVWVSSLAAAADVRRPFMLWNADDIATTRKRIQTQAWAKAALDRLPKAGDRDGAGFGLLLRYAVLDDKAAGEAEKRALLASVGDGKGMSDWLTALRYDALFDLLSPAERDRVDKAFGAKVRGTIDSMKGRGWTRWNWLPNLAYPWLLAVHLQAAATGDKQLCRAIFEAPYCLKWYFDEYLSDLGFYNEEFGKMFATPGAMLMWCRAMERLGLDEIGYGYKGRQGASMRGHIESLLRIGMPSVDAGSSRRHYPRLSMGDAKGHRGGLHAYGFQHDLVPGYPAEGDTERRDWFKGLLPQSLWFEIAHAKWPDAGFGYLLAQMRAPDEEQYYPTLYFGLDAIDPRQVKPPPAPSGVYPGRGLVVLRAEEGPAHWESPAPAVGMRLATPYAHHIQDAFCLTGFYAFNRPLYINQQRSTNYSGVDPGYSNSSRSHTIVRVDNEEPRSIGEVATRHEFTPDVKFVAARGQGIFPGVDQTRALFLTREYLLDVSHLVSGRPRFYQWIVNAIGNTCPDRPGLWTPSQELVGTLFDVAEERTLATDQTWSVTAVQSSGGANRQFSGMGRSWFERRVGVKITMLGEPNTSAYTAWSPVVLDSPGQWRGRDRFAFGEDEPAAAAIVASRKGLATTFVALHEPFEGAGQITSFERLVQKGGAFVVRVAAPKWTDHLMMRLGDGHDQPTTLQGEGGSFTFANYAYVRQSAGRVDASGDLRAALIPTALAVKSVTLNGKQQPVESTDGWLRLGDAPQLPKDRPAPAAVRPGPIAARWNVSTPLCVPTGGQGTRTLKLRNNGTLPLSADLLVICSKGLSAKPVAIRLEDFAPGAERDVEVAFAADKAFANRMVRADVACEGGAVDVQPATLKVANGVTSERTCRWPADFVETVYSPRYVARYYYMDSGAAGLLLDPLGFRRTDHGASSYPRLLRAAADPTKRAAAEKIPKFAYFIPILVKDLHGDARALYEGGKHAHGTQSGLEHLFGEDWILCRYRDAQPGEKLTLDYSPESWQNFYRTIPGRNVVLAQRKMPGKMMLASPDGQVQDLGDVDDPAKRGKAPKASGKVSAVFVRPHGYVHGAATFYPKDSELSGGRVLQAGDQPMGFTFCTEEEFAPLVKKWLVASPADLASKEDQGRYHGAFGAVKPDLSKE